MKGEMREQWVEGEQRGVSALLSSALCPTHTRVWTMAGRCILRFLTVWNTSTSPSPTILSRMMCRAMNTPLRPMPLLGVRGQQGTVTPNTTTPECTLGVSTVYVRGSDTLCGMALVNMR